MLCMIGLSPHRPIICANCVRSVWRFHPTSKASSINWSSASLLTPRNLKYIGLLLIWKQRWVGYFLNTWSCLESLFLPLSPSSSHPLLPFLSHLLLPPPTLSSHPSALTSPFSCFPSSPSYIYWGVCLYTGMSIYLYSVSTSDPLK